jgi:alpha-glucosidase
MGSLAAAGCAPWASERDSLTRFSARSPNGKLRATILIAPQPSQGAVMWEVSHADRAVILPSTLGLILADGRRLGLGARVVGHRVLERNDHWKPPYGIQSEYGGAYEELTVNLQDPKSGIGFDVIVRVYDAGVAIRYLVRQNPSGAAVVLTGEATTFKLPPGALVYASRDEGEYQVTTPAGLSPIPDPPLTLSSDSGPLADVPVGIRIDAHLNVVITESDRRHYPRMMLRPAPEATDALVTHLMRYPGRADGWSGPGETPPSDSFALPAPSATPWRVMLVATTPGAIIENAGLVTTLAAPNALGQVGWIRPGRAIRAFRDNTTAAGLAHVDFAVKHKLEYIEFDAHWYGDGTDPSDATEPVAGLDIRRVIEYGRARNVGVLLYVDRVPAQREIDAIVARYREWGVAGIKFGFMWEGRQADVDCIEELVRKCGERQLVVNLHDDLRPAGLERTYPNCLTVEGVRGNEHFPTPRHNVTLPFVRNIAGPMDYTICYAHERNQATNAHQLAMSVVYYSPLTFLYWYDKPGKYAQGAWPELSWFDECPVTWEETRVLAGVIGEYIVVARRSGGRWFLGAMTNEEPRSIGVALNFLGTGRWRAVIYADGKAAIPGRRSPVEIDERRAHERMQLQINLVAAGGQVVRFEPEIT